MSENQVTEGGDGVIDDFLPEKFLEQDTAKLPSASGDHYADVQEKVAEPESVLDYKGDTSEVEISEKCDDNDAQEDDDAAGNAAEDQLVEKEDDAEEEEEPEVGQQEDTSDLEDVAGVEDKTDTEEPGVSAKVTNEPDVEESYSNIDDNTGKLDNVAQEEASTNDEALLSDTVNDRDVLEEEEKENSQNSGVEKVDEAVLSDTVNNREVLEDETEEPHNSDGETENGISENENLVADDEFEKVDNTVEDEEVETAVEPDAMEPESEQNKGVTEAEDNVEMVENYFEANNEELDTKDHVVTDIIAGEEISEKTIAEDELEGIEPNIGDNEMEENQLDNEDVEHNLDSNNDQDNDVTNMETQKSPCEKPDLGEIENKIDENDHAVKVQGDTKEVQDEDDNQVEDGDQLCDISTSDLGTEKDGVDEGEQLADINEGKPEEVNKVDEDKKGDDDLIDEDELLKAEDEETKDETEEAAADIKATTSEDSALEDADNVDTITEPAVGDGTSQEPADIKATTSEDSELEDADNVDTITEPAVGDGTSQEPADIKATTSEDSELEDADNVDTITEQAVGEGTSQEPADIKATTSDDSELEDADNVDTITEQAVGDGTSQEPADIKATTSDDQQLEDVNDMDTSTEPAVGDGTNQEPADIKATTSDDQQIEDVNDMDTSMEPAVEDSTSQEPVGEDSVPMETESSKPEDNEHTSEEVADKQQPDSEERSAEQSEVAMETDSAMDVTEDDTVVTQVETKPAHDEGDTSEDVATSMKSMTADISKETVTADVSKETMTADAVKKTATADVSKETVTADVSKETVTADVSKETVTADVSKETEMPSEAEAGETNTDVDMKDAEDQSSDKVDISNKPDQASNSEAASLKSEATPPEAETPPPSTEDTPTADNSTDVSDVKIKQEHIEKEAETKEESKDTETGGSEESDTSVGLKIVGVTSAIGVDDKADNKGDNASVKENNSSDLGLKISAVSGSGDTKMNAVSDQIKIKQEAVAAAKAEVSAKTEESKTSKENVKKEAAAAKEDDDDDVIAIKEEKKPPPKPKQSSKIQKCIVCAKVGKCKYNIVRNGDVKHLCDDTCFKRFRSNPTTYLRQAETKNQDSAKNGNQATVASAPQKAPATPVPVKNAPPQAGVYKTCNVCQLMNVRTSKPFLNWQGLDFCGEECLGKFQGGLSVSCSYCSSQIHQTNKAKYCCRVGNDVKHFCSIGCNNEFVKRMKLCAFCNKDLAQVVDSFMAPVGNQGTFKDFCSQTCLQKFEDKNSKDLEIVGVQKGQKTALAPKGNFCCAVCSKVGPVKHEFKLEGKVNRLCSDPCYSAFQYANKLTLNTCDNCGTSCYNEGQTPQYIQYEGQQKRFCTFMCVNTFRNTNKKTVACGWCSTKKNNFDMIERVDANNKYQLFCSLNCLSLYRVNLQATSNQAVLCDQCRKFVPAQYHLTMSDASVRNFCSYGCVMQFQAQFQVSAKQVQQPSVTTPPPAQQQTTTTRSGRMVTRGVTAQQKTPSPASTKASARGNRNASSADSFPIISNVVSLAPQGSQQQINIKSSTPVTVTGQQPGVKTTTTTTGNQTVQQQIIIQPPPPKSVKNKSLLCKPFVQTKATSCRPHTQTKETQTDGKVEPDKYLVPVPVPLYCPTPLAMYSMPTPIYIPVPIPIPIPVFIPTTKKSSASILKQIKEIQEKIPADPLEAELLMMAEAVAGKESESSSESEDEGDMEVPPPIPTKERTPTPAGGGGGDLGEDMLQMALRMASEMSEEPVMDLEASLEPMAVNTVAPAVTPTIPKEEPEEEDEDEFIPPSARTRRGGGGGGGRGSSTKRSSRGTPRRNPKRQRVDTQPDFNQSTPSPPPPTAPPPDANFHLKYTYGVNAFKHWVIQKNVQIEQASKPGLGKPLKTYKTDILQCTADELNFSLCLFVKEVRKPNGEEYAVDSIFYLCLGIQQYLFESGRIDNIFTDSYYERFTECLNELLTRYEPKLNHAGQLVCRIEEEHLWESKQLGAHSPHVLLNSLVYFNTKYFMLKTSEDHLKLSFTHIMKHWKKTPSGRGSGTGPNAGRSVYLRYYCPTPQGKDANAQKKKKEEMPVYEQTENLDNPLRCPVKLYEFYLSKCPESIKNRNDTFYLVPERSCVPDSPVWYSTAMLGIDQMAKMLNRVRLVREIQEAHLHTQPIYI